MNSGANAAQRLISSKLFRKTISNVKKKRSTLLVLFFFFCFLFYELSPS